MDREELVKRINKMIGILNTLNPVDNAEDFETVREDIIKLSKLLAEYDENCDKQLERQEKLDIEKERLKLEQLRIEKEFEIKFKELELRIEEAKFKSEIESMKVEQADEEAAARKKAAKWQAIWDLIKIAAQIAGTALLIGLTGKLEQSVILGNHKWSLIQKFFK